MGDNSKKPGIRFKGFTDDWEQRKLGELGTITTGNTPSTSIPDYYSDDGIVWVTPTDICENITFESARKLSDLGQQVGRVVPKNTILVTCIASIGKNTMLGNTGSFNQQINGLTPNENKYDPYFLLTESALWSAKMKGSAAAGTMQIVNRTEFSELKTWLPSLIEQQAIGAFFKQLDHLITLHQRKYDKLVMSKKSMLEKMFPKNGQTKPEIRFSGFIDDWEQRKLGELGSLKNGMNFSKKAMGIGFPFVNLQNIFGNNVIDVSNLGKAMASDSQLKDYNLLNGDVLFVRSSVKLEGVGEAALVPQTLDNTTYSGFIIRFRDEYGLDNNFKRFVFGIESVRNQIMSQATNSANKNISQSVLENLELAIPSKSEQQKIGAYFSNLDHLITLHQRELEKLKKIKLSMLEKMFV
jgi:type I restriction enzyme S subunit